MKFVALLRGINVGGKNIIKMNELKLCLDQHGLQRVATYIQSGNVIFESEEKDTGQLTRRIEAALSRTFSYDSRVVIRSHAQLKSVLANAPEDWKTRTDLRRYVAFLREPVTARQALAEVVLKPEIDFAKTGKGVLYLSTILSGLNKSGLTKLVGTKIYKEMTIRNHSTCQKVLALMERER